MSGRRYVLVPGAGGDAWYWHRVVAELARRGRDAVAVDLPAADETATFDDYADAVVRAAGPVTEGSPVVLVASSLAGFTAPLVCERMRVGLVVLLNAMTPAPGESAAQWWEAVGFEDALRARAERDGRDPDAMDMTLDLFLHDAPPDVLEEAYRRGEPDQSSAVMEAPYPFAGWPPDVPVRVLATTGDRFFPVELQRRIVPERLGVVPDEMPGGHLVALSRPVELVDRLESYTVKD
jgi:pimeloyl-ACP methyl ester carboxylesterase